MSRLSKMFIKVFMCLLIILTGACTANSTPDDDAMAAEETLQSIYAQETLSAENASSDVQDESSPSPSPQPAKPPKRPPLTIRMNRQNQTELYLIRIQASRPKNIASFQEIIF